MAQGGRSETPILRVRRVTRPSLALRAELAAADAEAFRHAGLRDVDIQVLSWGGAVFEGLEGEVRVGACQLIRTWDDPEAAWLVGFYVVPHSQGRGLGGEMLRAVAAEAGRAGLRRLLLTVDPLNRRAVDLYLRFGFVMVERIPDFYGDGEHRNLLRCELRGER